jgi:4-hydroxybenzoate polyprenyltransferase
MSDMEMIISVVWLIILLGMTIGTIATALIYDLIDRMNDKKKNKKKHSTW